MKGTEKWRAKFADGSAPKHVIETLSTPKGIYAGTFGRVYRLDQSAGNKISAKADLPGLGEHETRLAASDDGSILVVGTNGYIIRLDPTTMNEVWRKDTGNSGLDVNTEVAVGPNMVYCACVGRVYGYSTDGNRVGYNGLEGVKNYEVRLAIRSQNPAVLAGTNGYAVMLSEGLDVVRWKTSLPGCGFHVTSVIWGVNTPYAACNGRVYALDSGDGHVSSKSDLDGTGEHEVRLAWSNKNGNLYVGTNGYGLGLQGGTLKELYKTSLPLGGFDVTDAKFSDANNVAYFGVNGKAYVLTTPNGNIDDQWINLPDTQRVDVRLALTGPDNKDLLVATTNRCIYMEMKP